MSRSGYTEDHDNEWQLIMYRGAVASATRGARGQKLLRDLLDALDKLPERKLIAGELEEAGAVCALGAVGRERGLDMSGLDPYDPDTIAGTFGIAPALAREIVYENDECGRNETPEQRFERMRRWVASQIKEAAAE
jgi:hypothetical protein